MNKTIFYLIAIGFLVFNAYIPSLAANIENEMYDPADAEYISKSFKYSASFFPMALMSIWFMFSEKSPLRDWIKKRDGIQVIILAIFLQLMIVIDNYVISSEQF